MTVDWSTIVWGEKLPGSIWGYVLNASLGGLWVKTLSLSVDILGWVNPNYFLMNDSGLKHNCVGEKTTRVHLGVCAECISVHKTQTVVPYGKPLSIIADCRFGSWNISISCGPVPCPMPTFHIMPGTWDSTSANTPKLMLSTWKGIWIHLSPWLVKGKQKTQNIGCRKGNHPWHTQKHFRTQDKTCWAQNAYCFLWWTHHYFYSDLLVNSGVDALQQIQSEFPEVRKHLAQDISQDEFDDLLQGLLLRNMCSRRVVWKLHRIWASLSSHLPWGRAIPKVHKMVNPGQQLSLKALQMLNDFMMDVMSKVVGDGGKLHALAGRKTLTACDLLFAICLNVPDRLHESIRFASNTALMRFLYPLSL